MIRKLLRKHNKAILAVLILIFGILIGLLTEVVGDDFKTFLESYNFNATATAIILIFLTSLAIIFTFLESRQTDKEETPTNLSEKDSRFYTTQFYESLKERYKKRYESKLDGRFEITLEVSENWEGQKTKEFKGEYEGKGQISEAFEYIQTAFEKQGRLLIVGNPGVGKTVLLLKLALELLEKANIEKKEPFPVIFNLASWSNEYEKFDDWLISVLNSGEGLSKDFARELLQEERIIFLLDGLDELARNEDEKEAAKKRAECLKSLNNYLDRGKKAVICCRVEEFEQMQALTGKDAPVSAKVKVNDLTEAEVLNVLMKAQRNEEDRIAATNLLKILEKDENNIFSKVLSTPFYFTTALEIFDKQIPEEKNVLIEKKELENYLRKKFIEKKLRVTSNSNNFDTEKTKRWLKFLAKLMQNKEIVTFELANLEYNDLYHGNGNLVFSWLVNTLTLRSSS